MQQLLSADRRGEALQAGLIVPSATTEPDLRPSDNAENDDPLREQGPQESPAPREAAREGNSGDADDGRRKAEQRDVPEKIGHS